MTGFTGTYFDGRSSKAHEVEVELAGNRLSIRGDEVYELVELAKCRVEPALAKTRRTLYTPGGGRLDTLDHRAFSRLEKIKGGPGALSIVHWMESRWKWALAAVLVTICLMTGFSLWGIPWLARMAAFSVPEEANRTLGAGVLESADRHFFKPSELAAQEQERIRTMVVRFVEKTGAPEPGAFEFRVSPFGPNAFALPGDTVVITDELVSFVDSDGELMGVVAHELAHLEKRHAMRTVLQSAGVFVLVSVVVGDVVSVTSASGALPAILLKTNYSRGFEREADETASQWMFQAGYGVRPMIAFLSRVREKGFDGAGPEFLSTHPAPENRIDRLRELARDQDLD